MVINNSEKSIVEKIIDATFEKLEQSGVFTESALEKLRETAQEGNLNRRDSVVQALEAQLEE